MAATLTKGLPALPKESPQSAVDDNFFALTLHKYRAHVFAQRIRLHEIFQDFDPLRSGLMTTSRFKRCVAASMDKGIVSPITPEETNVLTLAFTVPQSDMVRWREFVHLVDEVFSSAPVETSDNNTNLGAPFRRPLSPNSEEAVKDIIARMKSYVKHHGYDVKSWFTDFDKYNNGYVTYNQFRRGIPQNLLSMEEEDLLVTKYGDPVTATVNYFKLNTDCNRKTPRPKNPEAILVAKQKLNEFWLDVPVGTEDLLHCGATESDVLPDYKLHVEEKVKKHIYKNRIRLIEFFRDYDRHNCGYVTEEQFHAGLKNVNIPMTRAECSVLIEYWKRPYGLAYRDFCTSIDKVFTINHLETNPLANVEPPSREWLVSASNTLSPQEEERCAHVIARLQNLMKQRRVFMLPFFKDFDKILGNLGRVTKSHFSRLLSTFHFQVSDDELHLLFRKYEDSEGKVNYMEFIRNIDQETYNAHKDKPSSKKDTSKAPSNNDAPQLSAEELIAKIQLYVKTRRVQISEFFKDFDKLRSYSIRRDDFSRGLACIMDLSQQDLDCLCEHYQDEKRPGYCRWKEFYYDIERVFGEFNLESKPTYVHPPEKYISPFITKDNKLSPEEEVIMTKTLQSIRNHLRIRQWSVKPFFRDFDKLCTGTGHVTKAQFRRCLAYMKCDVSDEEFEILCKRWTQSPSGLESDHSKPQTYMASLAESICYIPFLEELDAGLEQDEKQALAEQKQVTSKQEQQDQSNREFAFEKLLMKIKIKTKTERIRVADFLSDFDHLRKGYISKNSFRRAIKVVFPDLTVQDLELLESKFECETDSQCVYYRKFANTVDAVFTKQDLVKNPTEEPEIFDVYSNGWEADPFEPKLTKEEEQILQRVMSRIHSRVKSRRIDALSYMEDYDFVKEGTITVNQFRSVLNSMNLGVTDFEMKVISKFFSTNESATRVNYRKLAEYKTPGDE
ncbi:hypothetical protein EDD86DRAFT_250783 [Gorgonomyces haynaldii]|nr:hypothetical protein EDD86DRAFT_250783 [Gorgonomyces haynaldii]